MQIFYIVQGSVFFFAYVYPVVPVASVERFLLPLNCFGFLVEKSICESFLISGISISFHLSISLSSMPRPVGPLHLKQKIIEGSFFNSRNEFKN